jgi:hypothetical protein
MMFLLIKLLLRENEGERERKRERKKPYIYKYMIDNWFVYVIGIEMSSVRLQRNST